MGARDLQSIGESIRRIADKGNGIKSGEVTAVDEAAGTCAVLLTGDEYARVDVLLNAVTDNDNGVYLVPTVGSKVWVSAIDETGLQGVVKCSNLQKVIVKADTLVEFNGGTNGGLVKVAELVDRLNGLENLLNQLITNYNSHTHSTTCGAGAGSTVALTAGTETGSISPITTVEDIENEDVKH